MDKESYAFSKIEKKWQKEWEKAKLGESEPIKKKKFFLIFAYPGISGYLHVGHMKGYTYTDIISRYKRMQGFNVLFPVGTHASGNLAIAFALKIKKKDPDWIEYLKNNGCPEGKIKELVEPQKVVEFFNKVYINDYFKRFGFIADWRRFTCTLYPDYSRFIQWQFKKLQDSGLLVQKSYYTPFCPVHGPVAVDPSETDISKGGTAEKVEFVLLKFKFGQKWIIAATLRPETVFGQTNLWINPDIQYEELKVNDEIWITSKDCREKFSVQKEKVEFIRNVNGKDLIGKSVLAPGIKREIIILPCKFADPKIGTGIVTSVPSDAPYDWIALKEIQENEEECKKYDLDFKEIKKIKAIPIIKTAGYGEFPAEEICLRLKIKTQSDQKLEEATKEIYKTGFHTGIMRDTAGKYAGMPVAKAKDIIKKELIREGKADVLYDLSEEVICRCGEQVIIKKIPDQWFIKYSDVYVKKKAKECAERMSIWPKEYYDNFPKIIDWFDDRACARLGNWLGTEFPSDKRWIVEPISDSTLYPAYYIVSKYVNEKKIGANELTEEFFDYVFLGKGKAKNKLWKKIREDFEYFYPLDLNIGGKEHQTVHFPVFVMNHVAVLDKKYWPKGIFVYWWILGRGGKISKSKGGAQPLPEAVEKYGVDALRLYYAHGVNAFEDTFWDENIVSNYRRQIEKFYSKISKLIALKGKDEVSIDKWIKSRINSRLKQATELMENLEFKKVADILFFEFLNELEWYAKRGGKNRKTVLYVLDLLLRAISPFIPHICEELWYKIGNKTLVSASPWPDYDIKMINNEIEIQEKGIEKILEDVKNILAIIKQKNQQGKKIYIYTLPKEVEMYNEAKNMIKESFNIPVEIFSVADKQKHDPQNKAGKAKPGKPAIYVE